MDFQDRDGGVATAGQQDAGAVQQDLARLNKMLSRLNSFNK